MYLQTPYIDDYKGKKEYYCWMYLQTPYIDDFNILFELLRT